MGRALIYLLATIVAGFIAAMAVVPSNEMMRNLATYLPALPELPPWVYEVAVAVSTIVAALSLGAALTRLANNANSMELYTGDRQFVQPDDIRRQQNQRLLEEITERREQIVALV